MVLIKTYLFRRVTKAFPAKTKSKDNIVAELTMRPDDSFCTPVVLPPTPSVEKRKERGICLSNHGCSRTYP